MCFNVIVYKSTIYPCVAVHFMLYFNLDCPRHYNKDTDFMESLLDGLATKNRTSKRVCGFEADPLKLTNSRLKK